ncbi:hypothetical protein LJX78_01585 [Methanimicrococcus blatticola]|nr:hypothetical protein [Methanimicrococcus blatticola]MBZ3936298.1 hypothetical protein [Methanimicrococcus blatticola]MCC2508301.1 hypothetical protein [Methanimicrococcus blatticola]
MIYLSFIALSGTALGAEDDSDSSILSSFADDISDFADSHPQMYWILLIFLIAVAVYVYYIWHDYNRDDDFLVKKH